jgi:asparagine synthase (glutamine-hydrolysing)
MCGIAGYKSARNFASGTIERMVAALRHRGPDSSGYYRDADYHAGMCRLSINDLSGGDQPLFNADRSVVLLYNGEIYNYRELRRELESKGHVFRTGSDGEVICHLYQHHGEGLFERLDGMFAAALWIVPERKLVLARDIPGEKPLYYSELRPGELVFASEIAGLKKCAEIDLTMDRQALWDFPTFLWVPEPQTAYRSIKALPRGHILVADHEGIRVRQYANRFNGHALTSLDEADVVAETRNIVEHAVKSRLLSDVPIGSFLSGGLDSSIVATIASRELDTLDTFSVGFEDVHDPYHGRSDESAAAEQTAKRIGSRHHSVRVTARSFRDELDRFCRHGGQPFAVSSGFGILAVARAAREADIKVLLSGDGADECFGGYSWYSYLGGAGRVGDRPREGVVSFQNFGIPLGERLATMDAMTGREQAWAWHYYAHEEEKKALFAKDFREGLQSSLRQFDAYKGDSAWQPVDFITHDRNFYFPFEMLSKVDRMTMAYSVESRVPFAAPAVLSHADRLAFSQMIAPDGTLKAVLRKAFADILPREVVERPKHGFNVPIDHWLKGEWADLVTETFAPGSALSKSGMIAPRAGQVVQEMLCDNDRLNGHTVFCMIMLNRWLEQEAHGNHS